MNVREVMTQDVITCSKQDTVETAAEMMKKHDIGVLPVVDESGRPVGMVTDRDIVIRGVAEHKSQSVDQVMTHELIHVTPETTSEEAADVMASSQVRRLPVVQDERIVGLVSLGDLSVNPQSNQKAGDTLTDISQP
ncbi:MULTISPECIES: CBS domain-containing protein [Jeotgalibacillus]|uniref:CBS domain-containing protein n=1 Tax=Jeotgalibacillus TaxID=157226 RepID=UPI00106BC89B|nr:MULTISPECIES: CBS domain-containing protein [Jeotgalibacillus]TFD98306.1 CBS domain-containing protein [Jeotgalibacillus sp. R-1-5s-1]